MARQKSSSLYWLSIHVFTYSILLFIGSLLIMAWKMALTFALINGLIHWVVDFFTSKISARYFEAGNYRFFFIVVGFDQLIHQVTLVSVLVLIH